jgi:hypothetical protein
MDLVETKAQTAGAGYAHAAYADSLAEFGRPIHLPSSGGWLLERNIADTAHRDAMGPYPLFSCANWEGLAADLGELKNDLVSIAVAPDPFGDYDVDLLRACFDRVVAFKSHFVVDLSRPGPYGGRHHRYYARKALRDVSVDVLSNPVGMLDDWIDLYDHLIRRHSLKGIKAFSPQTFRRQFEVPGLICVRAVTSDGACVGVHLWYIDRDVAYSHLAATNDAGYRLSCSYAIYDAALEYFTGKVRWVDLGGGAGTNSKEDGLTKFKAGWSNCVRPAYFCGRILNAERYAELVKATNTGTAAYFPAYRSGELA